MAKLARNSMVVVLLGLVPGCPLAEKMVGELDDEAADGESGTDGTGEESIDGESTTSESTTSDCGPDTSGVYLFAMATPLGPDASHEFVLTIDLMYGGDCGATVDLSFQPLSLDEFIGEPLIFEGVAFDAEGNFTLDMGLVMLDDIDGMFMLAGHVVHIDALCGDVTGMLSSPLEYDLAGSTFAAIRLADDGSNPDTLPQTFPYRCDQVPPAP